MPLAYFVHDRLHSAVEHAFPAQAHQRAARKRKIFLLRLLGASHETLSDHESHKADERLTHREKCDGLHVPV